MTVNQGRSEVTLVLRWGDRVSNFYIWDKIDHITGGSDVSGTLNKCR